MSEQESERELLELAAKAAGIDVRGIVVDPDDQFIGLLCKRPEPRTPKYRWNPLTDDGDALRLAVKLDILHLPGRGRCNSSWFKEVWYLLFDSGELPDDNYAATRRAIVHAAAEIGRKMP